KRVYTIGPKRIITMISFPRFVTFLLLCLTPWLLGCSGGSSSGKSSSFSSAVVSSQSSSQSSSDSSSQSSSLSSSQSSSETSSSSSQSSGLPQGDSLLPANYLNSMNVWTGDNNGPVASHSLV